MKYLIAGIITLSLIFTFTSSTSNATIPDAEAQKADDIFNNIVKSFNDGSFKPTIPANTNWYDYVSNIGTPAAPSHNHGAETPEQHASHASSMSHAAHDNHSTHNHEAAHTDVHDSHDEHENHDEEEAHDHIAATAATQTAHPAHDTHTDTHAGHDHAAETKVKTATKKDTHNHDHGAEPENSMQSALSSINLASGVATLEHDRMKKDISEIREKVSTTQYLVIAVAIFQVLALLIIILFIKNRP